MGSLADCVLADAILIPSRPPTAHQFKEGKGSAKNGTETSNRKTSTSKGKREM